MERNKLFIIFFTICFVLPLGCKDHKTKLELYSKGKLDSVNCKIGYIFYRFDAIQFFPCKTFISSSIYGGLRSDNLEEGFQQSCNTLDCNDLLKVINSADTFLLKYHNQNVADTIRVVPAYIEYRENTNYSNINHYSNIQFNEYKIIFLKRALYMKAKFKVYQIDKIIPLKPYKERLYKFSKDTFLIM